ncbi:hypothetical protein OHB05_00925 [Streptomyces sp. NBC_00638]|uniref:hypothetical protein n=1 Tax=unclassified Streptomyces TaxID=2593676 RepID=UPI0022568122|nr:hypothetical protein [Streptomyces sp. NBC_00638]MCX5001192.1 hypothetical protein [Streptomyces sp. NBC_00638]
MSKLVVVERDPVNGKDRHNVTGMTVSNPPVVYTGTAEFAYSGSMTQGLSDLVRVNEIAVALVTSRSALLPPETAPPAGKHSGPTGSSFVPPAPAPQPLSLVITDAPLGTGTPNAAAGSALLTINGVKVLLDGDPIDSCSGIGAPAGSNVRVQGQNFLTCAV